MKFACRMEFSGTADRMVWLSCLLLDRNWPRVTKCTHSRVVGLRLEGHRVILIMVMVYPCVHAVVAKYLQFCWQHVHCDAFVRTSAVTDEQPWNVTAPRRSSITDDSKIIYSTMPRPPWAREACRLFQWMHAHRPATVHWPTWIMYLDNAQRALYPTRLLHDGG